MKINKSEKKKVKKWRWVFKDTHHDQLEITFNEFSGEEDFYKAYGPNEMFVLIQKIDSTEIEVEI